MAMTKPDFKEWVTLIGHLYELGRFDDAALEAKNLYNQGYYYGLNNGWAEEQDKEYQMRKDLD
jgi:hypothetical protein